MLISKACLRIIGEFDPTRLSKLVGLQPSFISLKDERNRTGETIKFDVWGLDSCLDKTASLNDHLNWLVERFAGKLDVLRAIGSEQKIDVFCSLTLSGQDGFFIDSKTSSFFSNLGITMEFSLIELSES